MLTLTPNAPTTFWVRDARALSSGSQLVYPVAAPTASAPSSGYAGRSVRVRGNAGNAPAPVTLESRQGKAAWSTVRTVTPPADGRFSLPLPLPDAPASSLSWRVVTGYGTAVTGTVSVLATFPPTATGPTSVHWNSSRTLSGTAVPGDLVTVWTRAPGTSTWIQAGSTRADSAKKWSFPLTITNDVQWRVTSPSGTSATTTTVVIPSIFGPGSAPAGSRVVLHGRGIPGQSLTLYRSPVGGSTWSAIATVTVAADGTWQVVRHPPATVRYRAASHGHTSRTITVTTT
jgi:hypothetical protein